MLGDKEITDNTATLKNMKTGNQVTIPQDELIELILKDDDTQ